MDRPEGRQVTWRGHWGLLGISVEQRSSEVDSWTTHITWANLAARVSRKETLHKHAAVV